MSGNAKYLVALYVAEHRHGPPVSSGAVADLVGTSAGTVSERFHGLADDGLVTYEPYEGATLTDAGREGASEHHEAYVTLSWFFRSVLDLDDYEQEALELAGKVSSDVGNRLATELPVELEQELQSGGEPSVEDDE